MVKLFSGTWYVLTNPGGMEVVPRRGDCHGSSLSIGVHRGDLDIWLVAHDIIKTSTVVLPVCTREFWARLVVPATVGHLSIYGTQVFT
jgi:hypothetical protein